MIEERLESFMDKVLVHNDKISEYINKEKGIRYPFNTPQLLCRVDKLELETNTKNDINEINVAKFKQQIENKDYKIVDITKIVPKNEITKLDADKFTVTEKKTKGAIIYNVSNQIGIHNSLEDEEEAFKLCNEINEKVLKELCK